MGTPDFAVPCLKNILDAGHQVCGVFTQTDKPKGRGYTLTPSAVKEFAITRNLQIFQPKTLKDGEALRVLKELSPELIVVVAYGKILPLEIINFPIYGCVNIHASLLPKYRGAAPIQWSILNGETVTGVTTMFMDAGVDTGDILLKSETQIEENETAGQLHDRLSAMGAQLILQTIEKVQQGTIQRTKQEDEKSCYASMLDKNLSVINWHKPAQDVHNLIRGLNPWPTAATVLEGKTLKIHKSIKSDLPSTVPGEVISIQPFTIGCGDGHSLELTEVQFEGRKKMSAADFLRGHSVRIGTILGEQE